MSAPAVMAAAIAGGAAADEAADEEGTRLLDMIHSGWVSQALCTAVELGLPDRLAQGASSSAALAQATHCNAAAMARLLRALASLGIVREAGHGDFELANLGQRLRSDAPNGLHGQAAWFGRYSWPLWGRLADSVRSGLTAHQSGSAHHAEQACGGHDGEHKDSSGQGDGDSGKHDGHRGQRDGHSGQPDSYQNFQADEQAAAVFNLAMVQLTRLVATGLLARCDFDGARQFVDVGGGSGELLAACLARYPQARGRLLELAHALPGARRLMAEAGLAERVAVEEGDFFRHIPSGGDIYLLKAVLHNWDDAHCATILAHLRRALGASARLVIVERVRPSPILSSAAHQVVLRSDLNMLIGRGGRERTQAEFAALLADAGLAAPKFIPAAAGFSAIVTKAVP